MTDRVPWHGAPKKALPAGNVSQGTDINGPYFGCWTLELLPFLEASDTHRLWNRSKALEDPSNKRLRETFLPAYTCPVDVSTTVLQKPESGPGYTLDWAPGSYRAMAGHSLGQTGDHYWDNPLSARRPATEMRDGWQGPMHTTAIDSTGSRSLRAERLKSIKDGQWAWGSLHPAGVQFVFCDGAVKTIPVTMDMQAFVAAATIGNQDRNGL